MSTLSRTLFAIPRQARFYTKTCQTRPSTLIRPFPLSASPLPARALLLNLSKTVQSSFISSSTRCNDPSTTPVLNPVVPEPVLNQAQPEEETKHAVVSTFDLFSIGIGPSS
ncbi:hypothetical protein BGZ49_005858, partial [Haplosporangium sp. Z 27]